MTRATSPEDTAVGAVDQAQLEEATFGDVEFIQELTEYFAEDTRARISEIQEAIQAKDPTRMLEAAHTIKGSSANLGAKRVAEAALELETLGRHGRVDGADPICARLEVAFEEAVAELKRLAAH